MKVQIKQLRALATVGTYEWEQQRPQPVVVNVMFTFDGQQAAATDDLQYAVDYETMSNQILALLAEKKFALLERLANEILQLVMADERIQSAEVEIDKPQAIPAAKSVSITVSACRNKI